MCFSSMVVKKGKIERANMDLKEVPEFYAELAEKAIKALVDGDLVDRKDWKPWRMARCVYHEFRGDECFTCGG